MKEGDSELNRDLGTKPKAPETAAGDSDRALSLFNASVQSKLLLIILSILR